MRERDLKSERELNWSLVKTKRRVNEAPLMNDSIQKVWNETQPKEGPNETL